MSTLRVKELLKEKGITGRDFAAKLGMTEVGFYKMLSETGNPPLKRLQLIAEVLEVDISELFEKKIETKALKCPHCGKDINVKIE